MAEELTLDPTADKAAQYRALLPQIEALVGGEEDLTANLANIAAALKYGMGFFWVGFYLVKGDTLVLGPFQGPIACTRILKGKGVCGTVWENGTPLVVPNVDEFPGHIACSSASKSEIVLPAFQDGAVKLILDVDSDSLSAFDSIDEQYLGQLMKLIEGLL